MSTTRVIVTEQHIASGEKCNTARCPIALALLDALNAEGAQVTSVFVGNDNGIAPIESTNYWFAEVTQADEAGTRSFIADLPEEATEFIGSFDGEFTVAPFELELTWRELSR